MKSKVKAPKMETKQRKNWQTDEALEQRGTKQNWDAERKQKQNITELQNKTGNNRSRNWTTTAACLGTLCKVWRRSIRLFWPVWSRVCRPESGPRRWAPSESTAAWSRRLEVGSATKRCRCRSKTPERTPSLRTRHGQDDSVRTPKSQQKQADPNTETQAGGSQETEVQVQSIQNTEKRQQKAENKTEEEEEDEEEEEEEEEREHESVVRNRRRVRVLISQAAGL